MPIFRLRRPLRGYIFSALLCSALAAGLTSASGSAMAASEMQELAATLHAAEFSPRVDQLLKAGHPAQALELADLGLEKNPRSAQLRFSRTVALERLGRTEEAAKALRSLIAEYPEIPEPYNNLAVIEAGMGSLEEAVKLLTAPCSSIPTLQRLRKTAATCTSRSRSRATKPLHRASPPTPNCSSA